ncbi:MAG: hypothetical protein JST70_04685 [Bacteroidetes bacterium]|nr:hypothetical protein [Bacteroidota bacterium]
MRLIYLLPVAILCCVSCKKQHIKEPTPLDAAMQFNTGSLTGDINGNTWAHQTVEVFNHNDGRLVDMQATYFINGFEAQQFVINRIAPTIGKQKIYPDYYYQPAGNATLQDTCMATFTVSDQATANIYRVDSSYDNYVTVSSYDSTTHMISGSFKAVFYRLNINKPALQGFADTLHMQGIYSGYIRRNTP